MANRPLLRAVTPNPSIFHKALAGISAYDAQIRDTARARRRLKFNLRKMRETLHYCARTE